MKKYLLLILLLIMFIPVVANAAECDISKVYIDSIKVDTTNNVNEIERATANDKSINLNLNMSNLGDNIRYRIVIVNDSDEDFVLDKKSINTSSKYVDYVLESNDNSNVIKSKTAKAVYLRVNYSNPVPRESYQNGVFNDKVTMKVNLSSGENISNPDTGSVVYFIFISFVIFLMAIVFMMFRRNRLAMVFIFGLFLLIPIGVNALCKCELEIVSNIKIEPPTYEVHFLKCYFGEFSDYENQISDNRLSDKKYIVREGMTIYDVNSSQDFLRLNPTYQFGDFTFGSSDNVFPLDFYQCINKKEYIERYANMSSDDLTKYNNYWDNFYTCLNKDYDYPMFERNIVPSNISELPLVDSSKVVYFDDDCVNQE